MATIVLGDIVTIVKEVVNPKTCGLDKFVGLEHYDAGEPLITRFGSPENLDTNVKHFCKGDILVARRNVYLKRAGYVDFEGVTSGDSIVLRVKDPAYLRILPFILNTEDFWDYAEQNSDGTMSKRLSPDDLLDYEFEEPADKELLADKLWAAYRVKESYRRLLCYSEKLLTAKYTSMFGDFQSNELYTLENLIEKGVITYHLDGNHGGEYPRSEEFVEEGIPYIGANCIENGLINMALAKHLTIEKFKKLRKGFAIDEDVLFAHNATVGPVAILRTTENVVVLSTSLTAYRCNKEYMNPYFLRSYMLSDGFVSQYKGGMKQSTRNQIPITQQRTFIFPLPSIELQKQFANFAAKIETTQSSLRQSIDAIDRVIRSLINQ